MSNTKYQGHGTLTESQFWALVNKDNSQYSKSRQEYWNGENDYYINDYLWSVQESDGIAYASVIDGGDPSTDDGVENMLNRCYLMEEADYWTAGSPYRKFVSRYGDLAPFFGNKDAYGFARELIATVKVHRLTSHEK